MTELRCSLSGDQANELVWRKQRTYMEAAADRGECAQFHLRTKVARQAADGGSAVCIFVRGSESWPEPWPTLAPPVYVGL